MSRSFHITRKHFRHCSKSELQEMMADEYSEFQEWAKKRQVKNLSIEQREFEKSYAHLIQDTSLTDSQIQKLDDRDTLYQALHRRYFSNTKEFQ